MLCVTWTRATTYDTDTVIELPEGYESLDDITVNAEAFLTYIEYDSGTFTGNFDIEGALYITSTEGNGNTVVMLARTFSNSGTVVFYDHLANEASSYSIQMATTFENSGLLFI